MPRGRPVKRTFTQSGLALGPRAPYSVKRRISTTRGRYAGRTRQVGYWGRYPGAGGRMSNVEMKFHDVDWDQAAADLSAGIISNGGSLVFIGQGVTEKTRIGRKAVIKSVGWRGHLHLIATSSTSVQASAVVRLILFIDTQANGVTPSVTGTGGLLVSADYASFNNLVNKGRYRVLKDKMLTFNALAAAGNGTANDTGANKRHFSVFKKLDLPIEYSGVADPSVMTELRTNNICGIIIADTNLSIVTMDSKLRFRFLDG